MAKILVIDDDADFVEAVRLVLERAGHSVEAAPGPDEGVEKIRTCRPDLVLLDVMMPSGYEGFGVARKIREEMGLRSLPLVIVTGVHDRKKVPYRFAPDDQYLPVDVFLDKPVAPDQLLATVGELLGERRVEPKSPL
jgi:CheY-like chemotaxis protein